MCGRKCVRGCGLRWPSGSVQAQRPVDCEVGDHNVVYNEQESVFVLAENGMSNDEQTGGGKGDLTAVETEERLEARLLERIMQKVQEQLPPSEHPVLSTELPKKGQS